MRLSLTSLPAPLRWTAFIALSLIVLQGVSSVAGRMLLMAQVRASADSEHPLRLEDYDGGLFRSQAFFSLGLGDPEDGSALVRAEIAHGPWLPDRGCGGRTGLILMTGTVMPTVDTPRLGHYFDTADAPRFCLSVRPGGAAHLVVEVPAFQGPTFDPREDGSELALSWAAFRMDVETDGEGGSEFRLRLPRLSTESLTPASLPDPYGWRLYLERYRDFTGVTGRFTRHPDAGQGSDWTVAIEVHEYRGERVLGRENAARVLHRGRLEINGHRAQRLLDLDGHIAWASAAFAGRFVEAGSMDVSVGDLDGAAIGELIQVLDAMDLALPDEDSGRIVRGTLDHYLPRIVAPGPEVRVGPFRQTVEDGELAIMAQLDFPAEVLSLPRETVLQELRGRLSLALPRSMLLQAFTELSEVRAEMQEDGSASVTSERERWYQARRQAREMLTRMESEGWVETRGGQLETVFSLQRGEWALNGRSVGRGLDTLGPVFGLEPEPGPLIPPDETRT